MRIDASRAVLKIRPDLEDVLWNIACYCKEEDHDIRLMGLWVRARADHRTGHWNGWAWPREESNLYGVSRVHPAGRIDLALGQNVTEPTVVRLFAHELRHIGQFHRGRKQTGFMNILMGETEIEPDCDAFADTIVKLYKKDRFGTGGYEKHSN